MIKFKNQAKWVDETRTTLYQRKTLSSSRRDYRDTYKVPPGRDDGDKRKTGVVITTHGNYGRVSRECVQSFIEHIPKPCHIVLIINESNDPETEQLEKQLLLDDAADVVRLIKDTGGLTETWNLGIEKCQDAGCDVVILSNHDLYVNSSITHLVSAAKRCPYESNYYFGPVTNNPGPSDLNKLQGSTCALDTDPHVLSSHGQLINLNGFLMCFPMHVLDDNMFDEKHYFNPGIKYGGNETEWFNRFVMKGGLPILVPKTYVHHYKFASWRRRRAPRGLVGVVGRIKHNIGSVISGDDH